MKRIALIYRENKIAKIAGFISTFLLGHGALQALQLVSGFVLLRWLSVSEYANFSMAFAFQNAATVLVEFGYAGTIVALVGNRIHDKQYIGRYIKAGRFYRDRLFIIVSVICIIAFPYLTIKRSVDWFTTLMLLAGIIINLYYTGWLSYYGPPLAMHKQIGQLYQIQLKSTTLRIILFFLFHSISVLNAWVASLVAAFQTLIAAILVKQRGERLVEIPKLADPEAKREMSALVKPLMPVLIFNAFQSQIMMFIISFFGNTRHIAELGALTKVQQLYSVFTAASSMVIAPFIARAARKGLFKKYSGILVCIMFLCACIVAFVSIFPQPVLWLLGPNYNHLTRELPLLTAEAGIGAMYVIMWQMNESRKWIFFWDSLAIIIGSVFIITAGVVFFKLNTITSVLLLGLVNHTYMLGIKMITAFTGFTKLRKEA